MANPAQLKDNILWRSKCDSTIQKHKAIVSIKTQVTHTSQVYKAEN